MLRVGREGSQRQQSSPAPERCDEELLACIENRGISKISSAKELWIVIYSIATSCSREELFWCWILGLLCLGLYEVPICVPPALPNEHDEVFQCWKEFLVEFSISSSNMFFAILDGVLQLTPQGGLSPCQKLPKSTTSSSPRWISLVVFLATCLALTILKDDKVWSALSFACCHPNSEPADCSLKYSSVNPSNPSKSEAITIFSPPLLIKFVWKQT